MSEKTCQKCGVKLFRGEHRICQDCRSKVSGKKAK